jgi:hypothetical protein
LRRSRRRQRGALRDALNRVSTLKRCRECGWTTRRKPAEIAARGGRAYWRRVQRCGSIHACAVCSAQIRQFRAVEISEAAAAWIGDGNEVYMITLTAPHDLFMALAVLVDLISLAFRRVIAGRRWLRLKDQLGVVGTIRSLEVTHGPSGWHPHLHVLTFVEGRLSARGLQKFDAHFRQQWRSAIESRHPRPPHDVHGVKIERCYSGEGAAEYVCKTQEGKNPGTEMARADLKTARGEHRVPFQILASAGEGNEDDLRLWHEYEQATRKRQCITWSKGLRDIVRAVMPDRREDDNWLAELTDDELVALEADGDVVARVSPLAMRHARLIPGFRVTALEAFEDGGIEHLAEVVEQLGFEVSWSRDGLVPLIRPALQLKDRGG